MREAAAGETGFGTLDPAPDAKAIREERAERDFFPAPSSIVQTSARVGVGEGGR